MEELKVGEYVRTIEGYIYQVIGFNFDNEPVIDGYYDGGKHLTIFEIEHFIVKHSFNIIDLIEEGDYVNGYKVLAIEDSIYKNSKRIMIYKNNKEKYERWIYIQQYDGKIHTQDDIKSIVTHEQFEKIEYEIEEEK